VNEFKAVPSGMARFSAANYDRSATISSANSTDSAAVNSSVATALGPIGAHYLAAFAPAHANNQNSASALVRVHARLGDHTDVSAKTVVRADTPPVDPWIDPAERDCWERRF
jgi:hypothetical protein